MGQVSARILAETFTDLDTLKDVSVEQLCDIHGIGATMANSFVATFLNPDFLVCIDRLIEYGVAPLGIVKIEGELSDKSFLITGTLPVSRSVMEDKIKRLGGEIKSSVTQTLDVLIVGEGAGSKLDKAEKLISKGAAIKILNYDVFCEEFNVNINT